MNFLVVYLKLKLGHYPWLICIFGLLFAPYLFPVETVSLATSFVGVPGLLFLAHIDELQCLIKWREFGQTLVGHFVLHILTKHIEHLQKFGQYLLRVAVVGRLLQNVRKLEHFLLG